MPKTNIFRKIVFLLLLLVIPIGFLFGYTNQVNMNVFRKEIETSNVNRISFFVSQLNERVSQLSLLAVMIGTDSTIRQYQLNYMSSSILNLDRQKMKEAAQDMMRIQSLSAGWTNIIKLYSPSLGEYVGSTGHGLFNNNDLVSALSLQWRGIQSPDKPGVTFVRHIVEPYAYRDQIDRVNTVVEISFDSQNISRMLDEFKSRGEYDPFLYHNGFDPILNSTSNRDTTGELMEQLNAINLDKSGFITLRLAGMEHLVVYQIMDELDWYAVDYVPMQQILTPITESRNWFYIAIILLLALSLSMAVVIYRNVRVPILRLIRALNQLQQGDFSTRIRMQSRNEFQFLFDRFNQMAAQINKLITSVYEEKIRSREATLKQLQSQINPHFLYNCLAYITSMAKLKDNQAVIAMALNLGNYYRYTTRVENPLVPLQKELELVENYLAIQNMRNERLQYVIDVPDEMKVFPVPRLLLQPIVENAVIHGIEMKPGVNWIKITGSVTDDFFQLEIQDTGIGMEEEAIERLNDKIRMPLEEEMGFGVWNVHQRLVYQFGSTAGLLYSPVPEGGLRALLYWPRRDYESQGKEGTK